MKETDGSPPNPNVPEASPEPAPAENPADSGPGPTASREILMPERLERIRRTGRHVGRRIVSFARGSRRREQEPAPEEDDFFTAPGETEGTNEDNGTEDSSGRQPEDNSGEEAEAREEEEADEESESDTETIEEDTADNWEESSDAREAVNRRLRAEGLSGETIEEVNRVLDSDLSQLVRLSLRNLGVEEGKIEETAHILAPVNLYLKKLEELGLPPEKRREAHHFLVDEVGELRIEHLAALVGEGKEEELQRLMKTHASVLLMAELHRMGLADEQVEAITSLPRRNKSRLTKEALKKRGLSEELANEVEMIILKAEVPREVAAEAEHHGIPLETVVLAREAFRRADWQDTFEYLKLAQKNEGARERLRQHGIEIAPREPEEEKRARLANLTLKEINEVAPGEWEAERARRSAKKKEELARMLEKFKDYLPLEDLPLPDDVEVPPEIEIPDDLGRAYGVWRRLLADSYKKRINDPREFKAVRAELRRVGGNIPILRKLGQRRLALRILRNQKRESRENHENSNFGAFGWGYLRYKENFRSIEEADIQVINALRALGRWHAQNYVKDGQATPRERLAENIIDIRLREIAFREGRLNPRIPRSGDFPGVEEEEQEELV